MTNEEKLPSEPETIKELEELIAKLEKEKEEYLSGWKRAKVDLLNYQKEMEEKIKNIINFANANIVLDLTAVLDSLDLAVNSLSDEDREKNLGKGYILIQNQILDILKKYGLEVIDPQKEKFNPNFHEAIATKKCEKENCQEDDDNLIIEVYSRGYLLNGKLLRPAKVKVIVH
ncbi:MAG: nucleotide exchange factor GrpE [Patescibacteria group bacterium]|nr:nucleotide exchange factor GrpE [Patescibacteria group bacterium]